MTNEKNTLIWIDLEMSGLDPERDVILEAALVLTNNDLDIIAEGPVIAIHQSDAILDGMDDWNKLHHGRSGLIDRVRASSLSEKDAEVTLLSFLKEHLPPNASPMCGNSICQDRRFLARYMPYLEGYFHYRNLDVSSIKELAKRWRPELLSGFKKENRHEALTDIYESIAELRYYRQTFFRFE
jgi:oligoribonuclease